MAEKKNNLPMWAGIGLVFGTAIRALIFAFTNEPWHIEGNRNRSWSCNRCGNWVTYFRIKKDACIKLA